MDDDIPELTTWQVLLVLFAGAAVGAVVLFADAPWWDHAHRVASQRSAETLWTSLLCAQTALWALALVWMRPQVRRLRCNGASVSRSEMVGSTIAILAILVGFAVVAPLVRRWPNYFPAHSVKLGVLTMLGGLVGLVAARGIWLVHGSLKHLLACRDATDECTISEFLRLRQASDRFLGVLGAIVGLLVLTTGAQRRAVLAYAPKTDYGRELVLTYGLFFTILVAAVYLPTSLTLARVGAAIRDANFPAVRPKSPEWSDRVDARTKLSDELRLDDGLFGSLHANLAILTPLAGSLVGLLLGAK